MEARYSNRLIRGILLVVLMQILMLLSTKNALIDYKKMISFGRFHLKFDGGGLSTEQENHSKAGTQEKDLSLIVSKHEVELLCNKTNEIVNAVRNNALLNETEALLWNQRGPFYLLTCEQLIRSLPTLRNGSNDTNTTTGRNINAVTSENGTSSDSIGEFELQNLISLKRLAEKLMKLEQRSNRQYLTVVVIGGSMTTGWVDVSKLNNDTYNLAFPRKLEQFMRQQWPASSVNVINIAIGGADENTWLGRLDRVMELDPDVILVESAVNDQCDYNRQDEKAAFVNRTSFSLLNILVNFPQKPAVISVELFRTAMGTPRDANNHCRGHVQKTSDPQCYYCPQWWKPQTWRENARKYNSVSQASYRDAVWPIQDHPTDDLCSKYWSGLSHPEAGVHAMVASTIFFQFLVVMEKTKALLQLSQQDDESGAMADPKPIEIPKNICLHHISSYRAMQGDPRDPFQEKNMISDTNHPISSSKNSSNYEDSCWSFRADVRKKYGWICEVNRKSTLLSPPGNASHTNMTVDGGGIPQQQLDHEYLHLSKTIRIGGEGKIIVSRLVSYDDRMAIGQVWFTSSRKDGNSTINIFENDPVWNISSWHEDKTSIPQPHVIQLDTLQFKDSLQIQWPSVEEVSDGTNTNSDASSTSSSSKVDLFHSTTTVEVTFHLKILLGSSRSLSGIDKFKLLGIVTC